MWDATPSPRFRRDRHGACAAACSQNGTDEPAVQEKPASSIKAPTKHAVESDFGRKKFTDSTTIDNQWAPLRPGMQFTFEGRANRGPGRLPHRVVFTVTDLTKMIDRVRTVVLWDRDFNAGRIVETELAFFAQDDDGNVCLLGEYPEEWEDGAFSGAPDVWFSGVAKARAGIMMRADPQLGTSSYLQGFAPEIEFSDRARVHQTGQRTGRPGAGPRGGAGAGTPRLRVRKDVYGRTRLAEHTP
jgi:hypothetical protein